jgi:malate dehydrogenase (oxaloacetate-decarboxylating)(NADP+)
MDDDFRKSALAYHRLPRPGKLSVEATKRMANQRDLALAYSPGVAAPCEAIAADPAMAREYTARGNLVAVISNGTAVLGLGNIGALASKPVMEGKAVLFKKFAGIDVFDLDVNETDIDRFVDVVAALEPTFGGINLEDIKAPECFVIEKKLRERMKIPVFHDDHRLRRRHPQRPGAAGQDPVGCEAGDQRRGRRGFGLRGLAGGNGPAGGQYHPHRHQGRGA